MPHEVTNLLQAWRSGDQGALEQLLPLVETELRRLARNYLRADRQHYQMQTTELLDEAFVQLLKFDAAKIEWQDRAHFRCFMAKVMRHVLVNLARENASRKRGGAAQLESLAVITIAVPDKRMSLDDLLPLNEALERLEKADERSFRVIDMRFFGGMQYDEIAAVLGISDKTAKNDCRYAQLWLKRELSAQAAKQTVREVQRGD